LAPGVCLGNDLGEGVEHVVKLLGATSGEGSLSDLRVGTAGGVPIPSQRRF
jgi:hypothetical protein